MFGIGGLGLNRWNHEFYSMNMLNSGLICKRHFSSFKPRNIFLRHKASDWTHEQSRKYFLKRSFMTKCKPPSNTPASAMSVCYLTMLSPPSCLSSLKSYLSIEKYFLSSLPRRYESINLLHSVIYPKSVKKPPFSKLCREKCSQSLEHSESLKSPASSFKYLKHLKYSLKRKLPLPKLCKQYSSSCPTSCPHSFPQCSQDASKNIQETSKKLPKSQRNKTRKMSVYRGYPIFLHRVHWRGFHSSLFSLAKSDSNKSSACKKMDKICKSTEMKKTDECGQPCKNKSDVCRQEKVKYDKQQRNKEKTTATQKPKTDKMDAACKKTCLPIGKCELPRTVPPSKMEYAKVTCPPPKFIKPKPCPPMLKNFIKDDTSHIETKVNARKKKSCIPPPLPKPPYAPIILCPCAPPRKVHPGPCPCYEMKEVSKRQSIQPCPLKKKYPCPTGVHYCPPQKKPCNLKRETGCEHRKKKEAPAS